MDRSSSQYRINHLRKSLTVEIKSLQNLDVMTILTATADAEALVRRRTVRKVAFNETVRIKRTRRIYDKDKIWYKPTEFTNFALDELAKRKLRGIDTLSVIMPSKAAWALDEDSSHEADDDDDDSCSIAETDESDRTDESDQAAPAR